MKPRISIVPNRQQRAFEAIGRTIRNYERAPVRSEVKKEADKALVARVIHKYTPTPLTIDVCICINVTGSIDISNENNLVPHALEYISQLQLFTKTRYAIVVFGDYGDDFKNSFDRNIPGYPFVTYPYRIYLNFTEDKNAFIDALNYLVSDQAEEPGFDEGGDAKEADFNALVEGVGGLKRREDLVWKGRRRFCLLVADSTPHTSADDVGFKYYYDASDAISKLLGLHIRLDAIVTTSDIVDIDDIAAVTNPLGGQTRAVVEDGTNPSPWNLLS